jgi:hypothetical protein
LLVLERWKQPPLAYKRTIFWVYFGNTKGRKFKFR